MTLRNRFRALLALAWRHSAGPIANARAAIRLAESLGLIAIEETPDRKRVIVNRGVTSRC